MTELTRYLTLIGALFGIGLYGLLTRRSQSALLISLGVIVGALTLALVVFNHTIRPSDPAGYAMATIVPALFALYLLILYPLISAKRNQSETTAEKVSESTLSATKDTHANKPLSLRNVIVDMQSFSSQISLTVFFIGAYLLARVSVEALVAFVLGVVALKYLLLKRVSEQTAQAKTNNNLPQSTMSKKTIPENNTTAERSY